MTWPFGTLRPLAHDVICADPPWAFKLYSAKGEQKSAAKHYETMRLEDIEALPVGRLAQGDCLLLLWTCAPSLPAALDVMKAWGFDYKSHLTWRKMTRNGRVRWGPGYRVRTMHELVLLGTMGNPKHKAFPSIFDGIAREHSRKPSEFYDLVETKVRPLAPLDLFSRQERAGWATWGNETGKFEAAA